MFWDCPRCGARNEALLDTSEARRCGRCSYPDSQATEATPSVHQEIETLRPMKIAFLNFFIACQRILGWGFIAWSVPMAIAAASQPKRFLNSILGEAVPIFGVGFALLASAALHNLFVCMALDLREMRCRSTPPSDVK